MTQPGVRLLRTVAAWCLLSVVAGLLRRLSSAPALLFMLTVPCSGISPRAVANTEDPTAVLSLKDTSFLNNSHASSIGCSSMAVVRRRDKRGVPGGVQPELMYEETVCYTSEVCAKGMLCSSVGLCWCTS